MKNLLALAIGFVMMVPVAASAQFIANSRHDLSSGSTTAGPKSSATDRVCVFCHVPHNARTDMNAIWSRTNTANASYVWGAETPTAGGTALPANVNQSSLKCFGCHDGTVALGSLANGVNYAMNGTDTDAAGLLTNSFYTVNAASMAGNHPVSVRYPGSDNVVGQYNGGDTGGFVNTATYKTVAAVQGAGNIVLYSDGTNAGVMGVECGSCHDPHGTANTFFLRASATSSALCLECHTK